MKAYAAIIFLTIGFTSATAQQQQPVPVAPPVTAAEQQQIQQQQVQQTDVAVPAQQAQPQLAEPPQPQHIVLRVVGSQVRNQTGERLGLIEEVFVHRTSGAVEYAVVSPSYPTNSSRQVPVPWGALTYVWDQARAGGPSGANQVFILNMDARLLAQAPAIDRSRLSAVDQTLASARNFFGVPQQAVGATGTPATGVTGVAAGQSGTTTTPVAGGVAGQPVNNQIVVPGQNVPETPDRRVPHINNNNNNAPRTGGQSGNAPAPGNSGGTRSGGGGASSGGSATGGSGGAAGGGATGR